MIGRGVRGRPWVLGQVAAALNGRALPRSPAGAELAGLVAAHYEAMLGFHGRDLGARVARKHLGWYLEGVAGADGLRRRVMVEADPAAVLRLLGSDLAQMAQAA
jgi:tRNA-dihydrouridine synthase